MVSFEQKFKINIPQAMAWKLLVEGIQNSSTSKVWPHRLAEISTNIKPAKKGALIVVHYRLGPIKRRAEYRLAEFAPPHQLRYETTENHPLEGGATVSLSPHKNGTLCTWSGSYQPKNLLGWPSIFWFKAYYERAFFKGLQKNLKKLSQ